MLISKISFTFKKAPFPAIMTVIYFVLFAGVYWLMTVTAIEPHYFKGLIFAVPFVCFGITTFFTVIGKLKIVTSSVITGCLIFILGFAMFCMFIYMAIIESTTVTTDIGKYERVLKLTGYPNNQLIKYFPDKIPVSTKNVVFSYCPAFLQGGENFNLKFETDSDSINNYSDEFSKKAKWIGKWSDNKTENNGIMIGTFGMIDYGVLPEDFTMYLFDSKPYHPNDWNHGFLSVFAVSKQRNEIIFHSEQW
ncbi:hypothetical protein psyc5s11_25830 [Clostridium gelidum]|uniref:Uncharacterized protein n=1 Tax=Clostridium gelidum TaxID=704125 RepID=A0ABM7TBR6_9CLOT|nr:hypothetical protein [Clostridium gelidum]BCZ46516.1 hypothetical protein psyc5s11_25830 [Clostridium gelidum]